MSESSMALKSAISPRRDRGLETALQHRKTTWPTGLSQPSSPPATPTLRILPEATVVGPLLVKPTEFLSEAASSSAEVRSRRPTRLDTLKVGEIAQFADAALRRH